MKNWLKKRFVNPKGLRWGDRLSIITDALKKAERERELKGKEKHASGEAAAILAEEEKAVESFLEQAAREEKETEGKAAFVNAREAAPRASRWLFLSEAQSAALLVAAVFLCAFLFFFLARWPIIGKNALVIWNPLQIWNVPGKSAPKPSHPLGEPRTDFPFALSGISSTGGERYAIVNGAIVQEGDSIDGAHVIQILDREVVLETRSGEIKLKILS
ncbi:MAG: hypothetical protein HY584_02585 [Candidatus Omnitrophica bacterium]|nr:hypothetical protein [Candidatus Omnitrophota bacterium]